MPFLGLVRARTEWGPCSCHVYRGKAGLRTLPWTQDPHTPLRTLRGLAQSAGLRARAPGVPRVFSREDPSTDASAAGGHGHPRPPPATPSHPPPLLARCPSRLTLTQGPAWGWRHGSFSHLCCWRQWGARALFPGWGDLGASWRGRRKVGVFLAAQPPTHPHPREDVYLESQVQTRTGSLLECPRVHLGQRPQCGPHIFSALLLTPTPPELHWARGAGLRSL